MSTNLTWCGEALVGTGSTDVAVNPVTNKIYVAKSKQALQSPFALGAALTSEVRGDTVVATIAAYLPGAAAVNPATNRVYVVNVTPSEGYVRTVPVLPWKIVRQ